MFLQVSVILSTGGACVVAWGGVHGCSLGGHVWLLPGGGMCGCSGGGMWWLLLGGVHGCSQGGMLGCSGGGGHVWFSGGVCVIFWGAVHGFFDEIRSMSGWYASYWNAFLFFFLLTKHSLPIRKHFDKENAIFSNNFSLFAEELCDKHQVTQLFMFLPPNKAVFFMFNAMEKS